jgi:hypothetical protein
VLQKPTFLVLKIYALVDQFLQVCDGPIVAFTPLHNINCNHGIIYVTAQVLWVASEFIMEFTL